MKDERGAYYYPFPQNKRVRMYVKKVDGGEVCFRLWNADDPQLWMEHGWVPHVAIEQASAMYNRGGFDPQRAYDMDVARAILKQQE